MSGYAIYWSMNLILVALVWTKFTVDEYIFGWYFNVVVFGCIPEYVFVILDMQHIHGPGFPFIHCIKPQFWETWSYYQQQIKPQLHA